MNLVSGTDEVVTVVELKCLMVVFCVSTAPGH